ncbi:MAG: hypothetical protein QXR31_03995 [Zestosphaera sp.]
MSAPTRDTIIKKCEKCGRIILRLHEFKNYPNTYVVGDCEHYKWGLIPYGSEPSKPPLMTVDINRCLAVLYKADEFPEDVKPTFFGMYFFTKEEMERYLKYGEKPHWYDGFLEDVEKYEKRKKRKK